MSKYSVQGVIDSFRKKHDLLAVPALYGGVVYCLFGKKAKGDVGIKSKGKLSFLQQNGYNLIWVDEYPKEKGGAWI